MAIYHMSIKIGSKSNGQSAVAAAAYRSGEKLTDKETGVISDYTRKVGVVFSEISLCETAPAEYADRATLWNAVHRIEKNKNAQLWREFEVALPQELSREEQIATIREFVKSLTDRGMCVDWSLHDKGDGNPHAHIMTTMRSITEDGKWAAKSRLVYDLDENGERIFQKVNKQGRKQYKNHKEYYNDWNAAERVEEWRATWAECCNRRLSEHDRIDHRSYARQGASQIPTVHEGYAARQRVADNLPSDRVQLNKEIRHNNILLQHIRVQLKSVDETFKNIIDEQRQAIQEQIFKEQLEEQRKVRKAELEQYNREVKRVLRQEKQSSVSKVDIDSIVALKHDYVRKCCIFSYLKSAHYSTEAQEAFQQAQQLVKDFDTAAEQKHALDSQIKSTINPFKKLKLCSDRDKVVCQLEEAASKLQYTLGITLVYQGHGFDSSTATKDHTSAIYGYTRYPISQKRSAAEDEIKRNELIQSLLAEKIDEKSVKAAFTAFKTACDGIPEEQRQEVHTALCAAHTPSFDFERPGYLSQGRRTANENVSKVLTKLAPPRTAAQEQTLAHHQSKHTPEEPPRRPTGRGRKKNSPLT